MVCTVGLLWLASLAGIVSSAAADEHAQTNPPHQHVRAADLVLNESIEIGIAGSPTFRRLVQDIEASDVVVYVVFERQALRGVAAHVAFMSAAGGRRYVHAGMDPSLRGRRLTALLGHELQHVAEIARERRVADERAFAALYERIGVAGDGGWTPRFDTAAAIAAGATIERELRSGAGRTAAGALRRPDRRERLAEQNRVAARPK